MHKITEQFPLIFEKGPEEDEDGEGEEKGDRRVDKQTGKNQFGIIPIILTYCKETNTSISEAMQESVNFIFYIASFIIIRNKEIEKKMKLK